MLALGFVKDNSQVDSKSLKSLSRTWKSPICTSLSPGLQFLCTETFTQTSTYILFTGKHSKNKHLTNPDISSRESTQKTFQDHQESLPSEEYDHQHNGKAKKLLKNSSGFCISFPHHQALHCYMLSLPGLSESTGLESKALTRRNEEEKIQYF